METSQSLKALNTSIADRVLPHGQQRLTGTRVEDTYKLSYYSGLALSTQPHLVNKLDYRRYVNNGLTEYNMQLPSAL
jgi:hypothetical protein